MLKKNMKTARKAVIKQQKVVVPQIEMEAGTPMPEPSPSAVKTAEKACECGHGDEVHYGSEGRWCNSSGCQCQGFK